MDYDPFQFSDSKIIVQRYIGWDILNVHLMWLVTREQRMIQTLICFKVLGFKFCIWTPWSEKIKLPTNPIDL